MTTTIHHFNERARFLVESKSGHEPYLVDLIEYHRKGFCGCKGFEVRKECEHIRRVRKWLEQEIVRISGITDFTAKELSRQVDRIIFIWKRQEVKAQLTPARYGSN